MPHIIPEVVSDGAWWRTDPDDEFRFRTEEIARRYAYERVRLTEIEAAVEAAIGQEYAYDIRIWRDERGWVMSDPFVEPYAMRISYGGDTPPQVHVYTRDQYIAACSAVGIDPVPDERVPMLTNYTAVIPEYTARQVFEQRLHARRAEGIKREYAAKTQTAFEHLIGAGLNIDSYSREQYERACSIMCIALLSDSAAVTLAVRAQAREHGIAIIDALPKDDISAIMATRRTYGLVNESNLRCDECGTKILPDFAMAANCGSACSLTCYNAMNDRRGRYHQENRGQAHG